MGKASNNTRATGGNVHHNSPIRENPATVPEKDRSGGLDRSDEEMQRASESGTSRAAKEKRASDDVDESGRQRDSVVEGQR